MDVLLCEPLYIVTYRRELGKTNLEMFGPNDMEDICYLAKELTNPVARGHGVSPALAFFVVSKTSVFDPSKEAVNDRDGKDVVMKGEKWLRLNKRRRSIPDLLTIINRTLGEKDLTIQSL